MPPFSNFLEILETFLTFLSEYITKVPYNIKERRDAYAG